MIEIIRSEFGKRICADIRYDHEEMVLVLYAYEAGKKGDDYWGNVLLNATNLVRLSHLPLGSNVYVTTRRGETLDVYGLNEYIKVGNKACRETLDMMIEDKNYGKLEHVFREARSIVSAHPYPGPGRTAIAEVRRAQDEFRTAMCLINV